MNKMMRLEVLRGRLDTAWRNAVGNLFGNVDAQRFRSRRLVVALSQILQRG